MGDRGHNKHGSKIGAAVRCPFGGGEVGPHLIQCGQAEAYYASKWHLDPSSRLATINMDRGLYGRTQACGAAVPLSVARAGSPSYTVWPGPRRTCMPSFILIHLTVWPQQTWAENWGLYPLPFWGEGAGSPSNTMLLGSRPTSIPSAILVHPAVWAQ